MELKEQFKMRKPSSNKTKLFRLRVQIEEYKKWIETHKDDKRQAIASNCCMISNAIKRREEAIKYIMECGDNPVRWRDIHKKFLIFS